MKKIPFILLAILIASCTAKEEQIDGYWYGSFKFDNSKSPALIKFENGKFIDYFWPLRDTVEYRRRGNKIYYQDEFGKNDVFTIKRNGNELSVLNAETDSLFITLKKNQSKNFIFDYLDDKNLKIELPDGDGIIRNVGQSSNYKNLLYLSYRDSNLVANFLDTTVIVNSKYHLLLRKRENYSDLYNIYTHLNSISFIIDKNVKMPDVNLIQEQLRLAGFSKAFYYLKSDSYEKINFLMSHLRPISELDYQEYNSKENPIIPPPPPPLLMHGFKGEVFLIHLDEKIITVNDSIVNLHNFAELIKSKLLLKKQIGIFYFISDSSTYQDYIRFNTLIYNTFYDVWDDYLMSKYNMKFRDNYSNNMNGIMETKKKFPMFFSQIDSLQYSEMKSIKNITN